MEDLVAIGRVGGQGDIKSLETLLGAAGGERDRICSNLAARKSRILRVLFATEQPRTNLPKATRPQFLEAEIDEARMES